MSRGAFITLLPLQSLTRVGLIGMTMVVVAVVVVAVVVVMMLDIVVEVKATLGV